MIHLEALSRELSKNLKRFSSETPPTATGDITTATIPVQIYVDETAAGPVVERELRTLLSEVGVVALTGLDPIIGSWYRRLFGTVKDASQTRTAHQLQRAAGDSAHRPLPSRHRRRDRRSRIESDRRASQYQRRSHPGRIGTAR